MTHKQLQLVLLKSIMIWTNQLHHWNYVADKIKKCWEVYEYDCNNFTVSPFWLWQFDPTNITVLKYELDADTFSLLEYAYMNWETSRDDEPMEICESCWNNVPCSTIIKRDAWPDYCDNCYSKCFE